MRIKILAFLIFLLPVFIFADTLSKGEISKRQHLALARKNHAIGLLNMAKSSHQKLQAVKRVNECIKFMKDRKFVLLPNLEPDKEAEDNKILALEKMSMALEEYKKDRIPKAVGDTRLTSAIKYIRRIFKNRNTIFAEEEEKKIIEPEITIIKNNKKIMNKRQCLEIAKQNVQNRLKVCKNVKECVIKAGEEYKKDQAECESLFKK